MFTQNKQTKLKAIQFLSSPFQGKHWEELKEKVRKQKQELSKKEITKSETK